MANTAVVTGASSGVGRAVAIRLARAGWNVAVVARRAGQLAETIRLAGEVGKNMAAFACDISNEAEVEQMAAGVVKRFGEVRALVNSAGTNAPRRSWREVSLETYRELMETNLTGAYLCTRAFLPGMRERKCGSVVNIVSDAGLTANAKAGAAYVMSKFGMTGMTQSLNCEERDNGIRATSIFPGDIDTPLLEKRPVQPTAEARARMLQADDVAACVMLALELPERAVIEGLVIRPR
jgi:NAD(P)-dependent dehydrogenase (short-subunit alcohol dehydrogenase family)